MVTYTPDSAGRPIAASDSNGTSYASSASYNAPGSLTGFTNGGSITSSLFYNPRLQLCRITAWTSGSVPTSCTDPAVHGNLMDRGYNFNLGAGDNGNVISITNYRDTSRSQTFTYDRLNRITSGWSTANTGALSWGENFTIDPWGNLMIARMSGKANGGNFQCAGDNSNRATCLSYDAAGNVTANGSAAYSYDQLTKPGDGWDVNFAKQAIAIKNGPYILSDGKDSGFRYVEYEPKKQVITLPHIEVNPCNHTGTIRDWHLIPKQVIGFEKNGRVFAYRVWVQMVAGPTPDSQVVGSNTHVIFYDTQGTGVFDSVRLGSGIETPTVPDWVKNVPTKVPTR